MKKKILLAGESWTSHTIHIKGFDSFFTSFYEEGAELTPQHLMARVTDDHISQLLSDILMLQVNQELSEAELSDYVKKVLNQRNWSMIK